MSVETPSTEVVETVISTLNGNLETLRLAAISKGLNPVELDQLPVPEGTDQLRINLTPAAFWSHYVSGRVASVATLPPDMSDMISPVQRGLYALTQTWMAHPVGRADQLNLASCRAFLTGGFAFDWAQEPDLLANLSGILADLGDQYSLREGRIPLG